MMEGSWKPADWIRWSYDDVSGFQAGHSTTSTRPRRSATRRASMSSLQISTDSDPHADFTTVRGRLLDGGGGGKDTDGFSVASCRRSSRAGSCFVHGQVAADANGPGRTAKTWLRTYVFFGSWMYSSPVTRPNRPRRTTGFDTERNHRRGSDSSGKTRTAETWPCAARVARSRMFATLCRRSRVSMGALNGAWPVRVAAPSHALSLTDRLPRMIRGASGVAEPRRGSAPQKDSIDTVLWSMTFPTASLYSVPRTALTIARSCSNTSGAKPSFSTR